MRRQCYIGTNASRCTEWTCSSCLGLKGLDSDDLLYKIQSTLVNAAVKFRVPQKAGNFMTSGGTICVHEGVRLTAFKLKYFFQLENT
jgi:hypothetical protein